MKDEEIKSNLDGPLYGKIECPLCHLCVHYDGVDDDWHKKQQYRCKKYGNTSKEYYRKRWHTCSEFKPSEKYGRYHKETPYDPDTWAEVVGKKAKEEEEYYNTPPWERGILKKK